MSRRSFPAQPPPPRVMGREVFLVSLRSGTLRGIPGIPLIKEPARPLSPYNIKCRANILLSRCSTGSSFLFVARPWTPCRGVSAPHRRLLHQVWSPGIGLRALLPTVTNIAQLP